MGKQSYFFPHDYRPTTDPKILALLSEYGALGYGLYWRIIEMLHSDENHQLPTKKYVAMAIARQMLSTPEQVLKFIDDCVNEFFLLKQENDFIFCDRVFRNINKQQEIINKRKVAGSLGGIANAKQKKAIAKQVVANKVNKNKEEEIKKRKEEFTSSLAPFKEVYGGEMLNAFYKYWTELNHSRTKMKYQLEDTWEVNKRLVTWGNNDIKFNKR